MRSEVDDEKLKRMRQELFEAWAVNDDLAVANTHLHNHNDFLKRLNRALREEREWHRLKDGLAFSELKRQKRG